MTSYVRRQSERCGIDWKAEKQCGEGDAMQDPRAYEEISWAKRKGDGDYSN